MPLYEPGDLRPARPAAPVRAPTPRPPPTRRPAGRWRRVALTVLIQAVALALFWLVTWAARLWLATVPAVISLPPPAPGGPPVPASTGSPEDLLAEQERLELDLDGLLDAVAEAAPGPAAQVRERRAAFGDGRLLRDLPRWLREAGGPDPLPGPLAGRLAGLRRRWAALDQAAERLRPPAP